MPANPNVNPEPYIIDMRDNLLATETAVQNLLNVHPHNVYAVDIKSKLDALHASMDAGLTAFDNMQGTTFGTNYGGHSKSI